MAENAEEIPPSTPYYVGRITPPRHGGNMLTILTVVGAVVVLMVKHEYAAPVQGNGHMNVDGEV